MVTLNKTWSVPSAPFDVRHLVRYCGKKLQAANPQRIIQQRIMGMTLKALWPIKQQRGLCSHSRFSGLCLGAPRRLSLAFRVRMRRDVPEEQDGIFFQLLIAKGRQRQARLTFHHRLVKLDSTEKFGVRKCGQALGIFTGQNLRQPFPPQLHIPKNKKWHTQERHDSLMKWRLRRIISNLSSLWFQITERIWKKRKKKEQFTNITKSELSKTGQ